MSRFDYRFELANIYDGIRRDLAQPVGQTVPWYVFDAANTTTDEIYDVGASPAGRKYKAPLFLEVANAVKLEGVEVQNDRGFYTLDRLQVVFSADQAVKCGLGDVIYNSNVHEMDRIVYENKVFAIDGIRVRGILKAGYAVVGVDCTQVKREELVNDVDFQAYIPDDSD